MNQVLIEMFMKLLKKKNSYMKADSVWFLRFPSTMVCECDDLQGSLCNSQIPF